MAKDWTTKTMETDSDTERAMLVQLKKEERKKKKVTIYLHGSALEPVHKERGVSEVSHTQAVLGSFVFPENVF